MDKGNDNGNLHHAYLVVGETAPGRELISSFLSGIGVAERGNPDVFVYDTELFSVEDAREVSERASQKAFGERKAFIISPGRFSIEAQNALLKTLEEPPENTHFFVIVREEGLLIPTLISRMYSVGAGGTEPDSSGAAAKFLKSPLKKRLEFAKGFKDEEGNLAVFMDEMLQLLRMDKGRTKDMERAYKLRRYAADRSASSRLILEHLAVTLA